MSQGLIGHLFLGCTLAVRAILSTGFARLHSHFALLQIDPASHSVFYAVVMVSFFFQKISWNLDPMCSIYTQKLLSWIWWPKYQFLELSVKWNKSNSQLLWPALLSQLYCLFPKCLTGSKIPESWWWTISESSVFGAPASPWSLSIHLIQNGISLSRSSLPWNWHGTEGMDLRAWLINSTGIVSEKPHLTLPRLLSMHTLS